MKDVYSILKELAGGLLIVVGVLAAIFVFFYFLFELQSKQHEHEKQLQAVQHDHEKQLMEVKEVEIVREEKKSVWGKVLGKVIEYLPTIGQRFLEM